MPNSQNELREILQLVRENNKMLHSMRRNAFLGGLFKFIIYAILFATPIWFYMTYISGSVDKLLAAVDKLNGTTAAVQTNFSGFEAAMQNIESHLPAFMRPTAASSTTQ
jgi:hypothetical protein